MAKTRHKNHVARARPAAELTRVGDVMQRGVPTVDPHDPLVLAAHLMRTRHVGAVVVVRQARLLGILTARDLSVGAWRTGRPIASLRASDVMTRGCHTISPLHTLAQAHAEMRRHGVRRLPVVERKELVGLLTLADLALDAELESGEGNDDDEVARTMAKLSSRPPPAR